MPNRSYKRLAVRKIIIFAGKIFLLSAAYIITGKSGLSLGPVNTFATLIWPPTGIALAALLLFGSDLWPGIFLGAFVVNFLTGAGIILALCLAIGNTLEAVVGAYVLKRFIVFNPKIERLKDALGIIIIAALGSTLISASIGTLSLFLGGKVSLATFPITWLSWWVGDMLGDLVIAPVILIWAKLPRHKFSIRNFSVLSLLFILLFLTTLFIFTGFLNVTVKSLPVEYIIVPFLIWISLAFGQRSSVTAVLLVSIMAVWGTVHGYGIFAQHNLSLSLLLLQGFIGINASMFLILSAIVSEYKLLAKRKDEFIAIASHELKTPLTSLKMFNQTLLRKHNKEVNSQTKYILQKMNRQIDRQMELIAELLDISRIQAGKLEYHMHEIILNDLITEIIETVQSINKSHKIISKYNGKLVVYADRDRIGQVLINLINNAVKYSPKANKVIVRVSADRHNALVSIKDFGKGIVPSERKKIFQRFFQTNENLPQSYNGLGLGLSICSEIIKQHHGKIWVEGSYGKGAKFVFTVPLKAKRVA